MNKGANQNFQNIKHIKQNELPAFDQYMMIQESKVTSV